MNIVRLMGGLGNQMFQYAFGRRLGLESGNGVQFDTENGFLHDPYGRRFALDAFHTTVVHAEPRDIPLGMNWASPWHRMAKAGWGCMPRARRCVVYEAMPFRFDENVISTRTNSSYYVGYWQHEKWFSPIQEVLKKDFTLRVSPREDVVHLMKEMGQSRSISIHLRSYQDVGPRGNVIRQTKKYHEACTADYYERAVEKIGCTAGTVGYVFSDNSKWAKDVLRLPIPCHHVSDVCLCSDVEEMIMMSSCQHHIISNSTFSWWGAWLGRNSEKRVVAPQMWIRGIPEEVVDICPPHWVRL